MSEKIYLKVPSKPEAEEVSHGNFTAKLTPKAVITVDNRKFADELIREYGLAEVDKPTKATQPKAKKKPATKPQPEAAAETSATEATEDENEDSPANAEEDEQHGGLE